ncbi:MAG: hypothetical protein WDN48_06895 [Pseudolabrys sp.]
MFVADDTTYKAFHTIIKLQIADRLVTQPRAGPSTQTGLVVTICRRTGAEGLAFGRFFLLAVFFFFAGGGGLAASSAASCASRASRNAFSRAVLARLAIAAFSYSVIARLPSSAWRSFPELIIRRVLLAVVGQCNLHWLNE